MKPTEIVRHVAHFSPYWTVKTAWTDDAETAEKIRVEMVAEGAFFARVFSDPRSAIGPYRIAAHFGDMQAHTAHKAREAAKYLESEGAL